MSLLSDTARCCECARPLHIVEPFTGGVAQLVRCDGCGVHLRVRRIAAGWETTTLAEWKGQRTAPLPAVARMPRVAAVGLGAVRRIFAALSPRPAPSVEPGASTLEPAHD